MPLIFGTYKFKLGGIVPTSNLFSKYLEEGIEQAIPVVGETYIGPIAIWKVRGKNFDHKFVSQENAEGFLESKALPFFTYKNKASHLDKFKFQEATNDDGRMYDPVLFYWYAEQAQNLANSSWPEEAGNWTLGKAVPFYDQTIYGQTVNFKSKKVEEAHNERYSLADSFYFDIFGGPGHLDKSFGIGAFKSQALWFESFQFYTYYGQVLYQIEFDLSDTDVAEFKSFSTPVFFHWHMLPAQNINPDDSYLSDPKFRSFSTPAFFHWYALPGSTLDFRLGNLREDETARNFDATLEPVAYNELESDNSEFDDRLYPSGGFVYGKAVPFFYNTIPVQIEQYIVSSVEVSEGFQYRKEAPFYFYEVYVDPENHFDQPHEESMFKVYRLEVPFFYYTLHINHEQAFDQPHEESVFDSYAVAVPFYYNVVEATYELPFKDFREEGRFSGVSKSPGFFTSTFVGESEHQMLKFKGGWQEANQNTNSPTFEPVMPNDYLGVDTEVIEDEIEQGSFVNFGQAVSFYLVNYLGFSYEFRSTVESGSLKTLGLAVDFYKSKITVNGWLPKLYAHTATSYTQFASAEFYWDTYRVGYTITNNQPDHTVSKFVSLRKADLFFTQNYYAKSQSYTDHSLVSDNKVRVTIPPNIFVSRNAYELLRMRFGDVASYGATGWLNTLWFLDNQRALAISRDIAIKIGLASYSSTVATAGVMAAFYSSSQTNKDLTGDDFGHTKPLTFGGTFLPLFERRSIAKAVSRLVNGAESSFVEYAQSLPFFILEAYGNLEFNLGVSTASSRTPYEHVLLPIYYERDSEQPNLVYDQFLPLVGSEYVNDSILLKHDLLGVLEQYDSGTLDNPEWGIGKSSELKPSPVIVVTTTRSGTNLLDDYPFVDYASFPPNTFLLPPDYFSYDAVQLRFPRFGLVSFTEDNQIHDRVGAFYYIEAIQAKDVEPNLKKTSVDTHVTRKKFEHIHPIVIKTNDGTAHVKYEVERSGEVQLNVGDNVVNAVNTLIGANSVPTIKLMFI